MADAIRDILDKQVRGRRQQRLGRVDGIVIELRDGQPPRLACIEMGAVTLARRLHPRLAAWVARLQRWIGMRDGTPCRVPWSAVRDIGIDVEIDVAAADLSALDWERWLSRHIVGRIPGS